MHTTHKTLLCSHYHSLLTNTHYSLPLTTHYHSLLTTTHYRSLLITTHLGKKSSSLAGKSVASTSHPQRTASLDDSEQPGAVYVNLNAPHVTERMCVRENICMSVWQGGHRGVRTELLQSFTLNTTVQSVINISTISVLSQYYLSTISVLPSTPPCSQ